MQQTSISEKNFPPHDLPLHCPLKTNPLKIIHLPLNVLPVNSQCAVRIRRAANLTIDSSAFNVASGLLSVLVFQTGQRVSTTDNVPPLCVLRKLLLIIDRYCLWLFYYEFIERVHSS